MENANEENIDSRIYLLGMNCRYSREYLSEKLRICIYSIYCLMFLHISL